MAKKARFNSIVGLKSERHHMETHAAPLRHADGTTVHLAITHDIAEQKRAERTSLLLSAIVDSSDDAIISKDLDGVVMSWKKSAERLFGYTAEEAIGQTVAELLIPEDRQAEEPNILTRLGKGERVDHFETVRRRKGGSLIDISLTISPVKDTKGVIIGASKIARDRCNKWLSHWGQQSDRMDVKRSKTILGRKNRPHHRKKQSAPWQITIERPSYDLTIFKVYCGKMALKIYTKGERVLRAEAMAQMRGNCGAGGMWGNSRNAAFNLYRIP